MPKPTFLLAASFAAILASANAAFAGSIVEAGSSENSIVMLGTPAKPAKVDLGEIRTEEPSKSEKKELTLEERNKLRLLQRRQRHEELEAAKRKE